MKAVQKTRSKRSRQEVRWLWFVYEGRRVLFGEIKATTGKIALARVRSLLSFLPSTVSASLQSFPGEPEILGLNFEQDAFLEVRVQRSSSRLIGKHERHDR